MGDLPRPARLYIGLLIFLAAGLTVISLAISPLRLESPLIAAALLIAACVAQLFKVRSLNHQSYYTTTIFFVAGALLLDPALVVLIVVVAHLVELFRERYRWYIQAFNIANFSLCALVAGFIVRAGPTTPPAGFEVARGVAAGIAFVVLNHLLTALVIMCARRLSLVRAGTLSVINMGTDLALMATGVLTALTWRNDPWLLPLCLGLLVLVYRSLLVPTLQEEARTDPKTSLFNLKHWTEVASAEVERAGRFHRPISVALADVDLLRDLNNRHGHLVGDRMIRRVADAIRQALREYDLAARFGGDEFAVLMPETGEEEAKAVGERIRKAVDAIDLREEGVSLTVTVSVGVACFPQDGGTAADLLAAADRAVYQAKALGRNRVCAFAGRLPEGSLLTTAQGA
jgi:diguanylate cyclase (GGDEF)-like protein